MAKQKKPVVPKEMTDAEVAAFNQAEQERRADLMAQQTRNRSKEVVKTEVDESIVRGVAGDDQVRVVCVRGVGLDNNELSFAGEELSLPKEFAIRLQDAGAIKVKL
jgi:hypothetical protein